jgi:hypothetical protein
VYSLGSGRLIVGALPAGRSTGTVEEFYSTHKTKASAKHLVSPIFSRSAPESNPLPLDGTAFHPDAALRETTLVAG